MLVGVGREWGTLSLCTLALGKSGQLRLQGWAVSSFPEAPAGAPPTAFNIAPLGWDQGTF